MYTTGTTYASLRLFIHNKTHSYKKLLHRYCTPNRHFPNQQRARFGRFMLDQLDM